jgi:hypothetical protein
MNFNLYLFTLTAVKIVHHRQSRPLCVATINKYVLKPILMSQLGGLLRWPAAAVISNDTGQDHLSSNHS